MARFGQISSKESTGPGAGKERPKGPLMLQKNAGAQAGVLTFTKMQ